MRLSRLHCRSKLPAGCLHQRRRPGRRAVLWSLQPNFCTGACIGDDTVHQVLPRAYTWPNDPQTYDCNAHSFRVTFAPGGTSAPITDSGDIEPCSSLPAAYGYATAKMLCSGVTGKVFAGARLPVSLPESGTVVSQTPPLVSCAGGKHAKPSPLRPRRRVSSGDAAEDGAGHQARAAGVVVEIKPAGDFAGGVEAGDGLARTVLDLGVGGDLEAAEGEGDAGRHGIGLVGRLVEALGPIGLVDREAARRKPVTDVRVEGHVGPGGGVEGAHGLQETLRVDAFEPLGQ